MEAALGFEAKFLVLLIKNAEPKVMMVPTTTKLRVNNVVISPLSKDLTFDI